MKEKNLKKAFLCGLWLGLSACQNDLGLEVYTTDVFSDANLTVPATLAVEIPSCSSDDRADYERGILGLFSSVSEARFVGCSSGFTSQLEFSFLAEITTKQSNYDIALFRNILDSRTIQDKDYDAIGVSVAANQQFLQRVEAVYADSIARFSYDDLSISLQFRNDADDGVVTSSHYAWVDGSPVTFGQNFEVDRRGILNIEFADIYSDMLVRGQQPIILWVYRQS